MFTDSLGKSCELEQLQDFLSLEESQPRLQVNYSKLISFAEKADKFYLECEDDVSVSQQEIFN
jgi:hypothetical protein